MSTGWKAVAIVAAVLAASTLLTGAFAIGVRVGSGHPYRVGPRGVAQLPLPLPPTPIWLAGHGVFGTVEAVDPQAGTITVANEDGARALVRVGSDTLLERRGQTIDLARVTAGDGIVAIGAPVAEGGIAARAVRVLDARPGGPAPLWAALIRGAYRIYRSLDLSLRGLLWRKGS